MNAAPVNTNVGEQNNGMSQPLLSAQQPTAIPVQATSVPANQPTPAPVNAIPTAIPQAAPMYPQPGMPVPAQPVVPVPGQPMMSVPGQPMMPVPGQPVMPPAQPMNLDYLMQFNGVRIVENINLWEVFTDYNATRKYAIFLTNDDGEIEENQMPFFNAFEESDCCQRQMCGTNREFDMNLCGPDGSLLVKMHRPFTCQFFCLNTPEMHILDANEQSCGLVKNHFDCCNNVFSITDQNGEECMHINGSCLQPGKFCFAPFSPCDEIVYDVTNDRTGTEGHIKRRWDSWARQLFTNADTFTILFPPGSTLHERILLIAATFLINVMYFEHRNDKKHESGGSGGGMFFGGGSDGYSGGGSFSGGGDFDFGATRVVVILILEVLMMMVVTIMMVVVLMMMVVAIMIMVVLMVVVMVVIVILAVLTIGMFVKETRHN
ncbi:hypothetical protein WA556_006486 [Blastocystis sp. ATCC 50177/Nand II]